MAPEAVLLAVLETCDDAIFTTDGNGRIVSWSATCERLFGRNAGTVIEQGLDGLFPEHLRPEVLVVTAQVLAGERVRHFETEVLRPEGMPIPISISMCPVSGDVGQPATGSVVVARDVTEQRLAQAALAEVEGRLEEGEALAHTGSWLWDVRTGAVQWSIGFHRIHGVDPLEFDGTLESHLAMIHPEDRERVHGEMEQSVTSGRPFEDEYRIVRPDGEVRLVRVRAQPAMGSARTAVGLRGTGQDITEAGAADPPRPAVSRGRPGS
jgi:PAS domain S-box-containing protein